MATGVAPRSELLVSCRRRARRTAPSQLTHRCAPRCDGVLAAGDVCKADNVTAGRSLRVEHWGDALTQGELAGRIAAGADAGWDQVPGSGRRSATTR